MQQDPIVEEVRRVREEHAARFNYDLEAIYRDIKEFEKQSGLTLVRYPPRKVEPTGAPPVVPTPPVPAEPASHR